MDGARPGAHWPWRIQMAAQAYWHAATLATLLTEVGAMDGG